MPTTDNEDTISEAEAARRIGIHQSTLLRWRRKGQAPPHYKYPNGSVRYPEGRLESWMELHFHEGGSPPEAVDTASADEAA